MQSRVAGRVFSTECRWSGLRIVDGWSSLPRQLGRGRACGRDRRKPRLRSLLLKSPSHQQTPQNLLGAVPTSDVSWKHSSRGTLRLFAARAGHQCEPRRQSSSDSRTISVIRAASSSGAKPTDRSNPSRPVISTRTIPQRVHRDPRLMWRAHLLAACDHSRLDALAPVAGDAFDREDRERHRP